MVNKIQLSTQQFLGVTTSLISIHLGWVIGISLRNASIPHYGVKDGSVQLYCDFDIETDKLLNLKWFKDEAEFFRFASSTLQVFPVEGINVDIARSTPKIVMLRNVSLETSGMYRCEVIADRSFQRLTYQAQMIVIAPPIGDPVIRIHGESEHYPQSHVTVGDWISGNCTSYRSKPIASLMFYINGQKPSAEFAELTEFLPINETGGLETSTLGFNFFIGPSLFSYPGSVLQIKCTASLGNHYGVRVRNFQEFKINVQTPSSSSSSGRSQLISSASGQHSFSARVIILILPLINILKLNPIRKCLYSFLKLMLI